MLLRTAVTVIAAALGLAVLGCQERPADSRPASATSSNPAPRPAADDEEPVPQPKVEAKEPAAVPTPEPVPAPKREERAPQGPADGDEYSSTAERDRERLLLKQWIGTWLAPGDTTVPRVEIDQRGGHMIFPPGDAGNATSQSVPIRIIAPTEKFIHFSIERPAPSKDDPERRVTQEYAIVRKSPPELLLVTPDRKPSITPIAQLIRQEDQSAPK